MPTISGLQTSISESVEQAAAEAAAKEAQEKAAATAEAARLATATPPPQGKVKFVTSLPFMRFVLEDGRECAIKAGSLVTDDVKIVEHLRAAIKSGNSLITEIPSVETK